MMMVKMLLLWVIALAGPVSFAGDAKVIATVDRNQLGVGDVFNYTISVSSPDSGNVAPPTLPALNGLELISTSSGMETSSTFSGGRFMTEQTRTFTYMLTVTQKGVLTIPPINVNVEGKTFKTQPIKISATNARPTPPPDDQQNDTDQVDQMEELFNQMLQRQFQPRGAPGHRGGQEQEESGDVNPNDAFFVKAEVDKTKAYVGEQITANFYLYTRGQIRDIDTLKYPDLKGFWKEEIEMAQRLNFEQVVVNGIPYQRALLVSYALFPIKAGKSTVDSYKAKCTVVTASNFGFGRPYQFTKSSKPIGIDVVDVPSEGRPADYSGAVGHFRVSAKFEPPTGAVNQPVTLRVRFEGQGNAKLIELPKLDLPPSFELYDQKSQAQYMKDGTSFKEFEVLLIPREPGVFKINPVHTSVFDPQSRKFTDIASQPLDIAVTGSAAPGVPAPAVAGGTPSKPTGSTEPAVPGLVTDLSGGPGLSNAALPALTGGLYAAVFAFLGMVGWTEMRRRPKRANLTLALKNRLRQVRQTAGEGNWRQVGAQTTNAIYYILGQISEQGGASEELNRLLEHAPPSLRLELSKPLEQLIARSEALSFAPEAVVGDLKDKANLNALIEECEKVLGRAIQMSELS